MRAKQRRGTEVMTDLADDSEKDPQQVAAGSETARQIDAALPVDLRRIVASALAGDPASRCGSAAAFAAELSGVAAVMDLRKR